MEKRQLRPPSAKVFKTLYAIGLGPLVGKAGPIIDYDRAQVRPAAGDCPAI